MNRRIPKRDKDPSVKTAVGHPPRERRVIILLFGYAALFGVLSCFLTEEATPLDVLLSVPFLILMISWCLIDAREHNYRVGALMRFSLIFMFVVALPIYLFRTRGLGAFKAIVYAIALALTLIIVIVASATAMTLLGVALGLWQLA